MRGACNEKRRREGELSRVESFPIDVWQNRSTTLCTAKLYYLRDNAKYFNIFRKYAAKAGIND